MLKRLLSPIQVATSLLYMRFYKATRCFEYRITLNSNESKRGKWVQTFSEFRLDTPRGLICLDMFIVALESAVSCYKQTLLPRHANPSPYAEVDNLPCIEFEHATLGRHVLLQSIISSRACKKMIIAFLLILLKDSSLYSITPQ